MSSSKTRPVGTRSRILPAVCAFLGVILTGTFGFMIIEDWDFWRSLFFTMITVTTVGYGAEGLSRTGEQFTAFLIFGGIGTTTYTFSMLVERAADNGLAWRRRMRKVNGLNHHYIICGFGRIGQYVSQQLAQQRVGFVVVEKNDLVCQSAIAEGHLAIDGDATNDSILQRAGIERAAGLVSVVSSDSENIVITLSARELNPNLEIIARADSEVSVHKLKRAGANRVVSPYSAGGMEISDMIIRPHLCDFLHRSDQGQDRLELGEVTVLEGSHLVGRTIRDYGGSEATDVVFVAIKRRGRMRVRPDGTQNFQVGDVLMVACRKSAIGRLYADAHGKRLPGQHAPSNLFATG